MKKVQAIGSAYWAGHLVNGDSSSMSDDDFAEMQMWLAWHGVHDEECVDASADAGFGSPDMGSYRGVLGELATYTFLVDKQDWKARVA